MRRNLLICGLVALMVALSVAVSAPALAGGSGLFARGDWQIIEDDTSGTTVRCWIQNTSNRGRHALVTFVGKDLEGAPVQAAYAVWVPAYSVRPVDITFEFTIGPDPRIIVSTLG